MAENEAAKITHIILRPPPGTRFSIWGSDVRLDFQKGKEREIVDWLRNWITLYIEPKALVAEHMAKVQAAKVEVQVPSPTNGYMPEPENIPVSKVVLETEEIDPSELNDILK